MFNRLFNFGSKKQSKDLSPKIKRRGSTSRVVNHVEVDDLLCTNTLSQHSYSTGNLIDIESYRSGKSTPYGYVLLLSDSCQSWLCFSTTNLGYGFSTIISYSWFTLSKGFNFAVIIFWREYTHDRSSSVRITVTVYLWVFALSVFSICH